MGLSLLGILELDQDPLQWADLPGMLREWVQVVGGLAFFGLIIYVLVRGTRYLKVKDGPPGVPPMLLVAILGLLISAGCFGAARAINIVEMVNAPPAKPVREEAMRNDKLPTAEAKPLVGMDWWADVLLTAGGAAALIGFGVPFAAICCVCGLDGSALWAGFRSRKPCAGG